MTRQVATILDDWARAGELIDQAQQELLDYRERAASVRGLTSIVYDGMPHGSTPGDPTQRKAMESIDLQESYASHLMWITKRIKEVMEHERIVEDTLAHSSSIARTVLTERYKNARPWWRVADIVGISEQYAKDVHTKIVKALNEWVKTK